ncbi:MAG: Gfo/Idh/MocA family oxidoreductase [Clostridia bacterium]|nr:Gfo/Idh/MocA family oxidoreductase [Clostridia bacterium]
MGKLKIGVVGLGARGLSLLRDVMLEIDKVEVIILCDLYEDRVEDGKKCVFEKYGKEPQGTTDYKDIISCPDIEAIVVTAAWEAHVPVCIDAMNAGIAVATEVGGAYSVDQCWELVHTYERTKSKFMMLENCCYGKRELQILNMVEQGIFGEIVHVEGGYCHDLRNEIAFGEENRHYRLRNYLNRNCENYPTHELGPLARVLGINHGNRMVSLTSTSSKAAGLHEYIKNEKSDDSKLINAQFSQGDVVTTVIKCADGATITLNLNTTLPRYYTRDFTVFGTKGMYEERTDSIFIDPQDREYDFGWKEKWGNAEEYYKTYKHPIWEEYEKSGIIGGHDGMDWLVFNAFFDSVINNTDCPIDVYDAASWMCVTPLSEKSILLGSSSVEIPDFTNGKWIVR